jgi:hypothetical protein
MSSVTWIFKNAVEPWSRCVESLEIHEGIRCGCVEACFYTGEAYLVQVLHRRRAIVLCDDGGVLPGTLWFLERTESALLGNGLLYNLLPGWEGVDGWEGVMRRIRFQRRLSSVTGLRVVLPCGVSLPFVNSLCRSSQAPTSVRR